VRILVVEDDVVIASELAYALERERHRVDVARDGEAGLELGLSHDYDVIVLDVMMPKLDGWEVCRRLRDGKVATPILMLTARDSVDDRVRGLQGGADDYLPKPFDFRELKARLAALARRSAVNRSETIRVADLTIDVAAHRVDRNGREIHLTRREFDLLLALARNEGRTFTRQMILDNVWNESESVENTVNFHVASLRKKIDPDPEHRLIHTVHGLGYVLRRPD